MSWCPFSSCWGSREPCMQCSGCGNRLNASSHILTTCISCAVRTGCGVCAVLQDALRISGKTHVWNRSGLGHVTLWSSSMLPQEQQGMKVQGTSLGHPEFVARSSNQLRESSKSSRSPLCARCAVWHGGLWCAKSCELTATSPLGKCETQQRRHCRGRTGLGSTCRMTIHQRHLDVVVSWMVIVPPTGAVLTTSLRLVHHEEFKPRSCRGWQDASSRVD